MGGAGDNDDAVRKGKAAWLSASADTFRFRRVTIDQGAISRLLQCFDLNHLGLDQVFALIGISLTGLPVIAATAFATAGAKAMMGVSPAPAGSASGLSR